MRKYCMQSLVILQGHLSLRPSGCVSSCWIRYVNGGFIVVKSLFHCLVAAHVCSFILQWVVLC